MLRLLRSQKTMRRVLRLTLILVIPSFIAFYGWSQIRSKGGGDGSGFYFARIKKSRLGRWSDIQDHELKAARPRVEREFLNYAMLIGMPPALFQKEGMERHIRMKDIIYEAIKERILMAYAQQHGFIVTDDEIRAQIKALWPKDTKLYLDYYLRRNQMSEAAFVADMRYDLLLRKVQEQIMSQAKVSLFELWQEYLLSEEKIRIDYVRFPAQAYLGRVTVTEDELKKFFADHIEDYRIPDQVSYQYLLISRDDLKSSVTVSREEVREYYQSHKSEYKEPRSVSARHIYIPVKSPVTEQSVKEAEEKIRGIRTEAEKKGADFASLADRYSEDPTNEFEEMPGKKVKLGGKLGWVNSSYNLWGDAFTSAVLKMEQGEISEPMLTQRGFHLVKADEVRQERSLPFDEAKDLVSSTIENEKVDALFKAEGERLKQEYEKYTTLQAVANATGLPVKKTGLVDASTYFLPDIGDLSQYRDLVIELAVGIMSEVLSTPQSHVVLQLEQKVPSHLPGLVEVREKVTDDCTNAKARELALADAKGFGERVTSFDDMKTLAAQKGFDLKTSDYFARLSMPPDLAEVYEFAPSTLNTPVGKITLSKLGLDAKRPEGYMVWHMKEKQSPSKEQFKEELPQLQRELLLTKRRAILQEYVRDQIAQLKIDIPPAVLER